jgi:hypothetical protein
MSWRFGRNRKRKLRELENSQALLEASVKTLTDQINYLQQRNRELIKQHEKEIRQARVSRDSIRITVDAILDPQEYRTRMVARFDMLNSRKEPLYSAMNVDMIQLESSIERESFIKYASEEIAEQALGQIVRHWRSR